MLLTDLAIFCYVILYFILAGQAVFYKFCFTEVFSKITGQQFILIRKLADPILETRLKVVYYSSLLLGFLLSIAAVVNGSSNLMLFLPASFLLLLMDVLLARKYNIPLNTQVRDLRSPGEPVSARIQEAWIRWIDIRGNFILGGFAILVIYLVFF